MDKYERYFKNNEQSIINTLQEIVERESPSRNRGLTNVLCDYLYSLFGEISNVTRISHENKQQKVGDDLKMEFGEGSEQVLILCHMDTVWEEGEILKRPFTINDNEIYGPGIFDMKYGIAQIYWALKALHEKEVKLSYKVVLYISSHEEIGSRMSIKYFEEEAKKSKCVLVLEPSTQGGLKIKRRGIRVYNIKTFGKNAHAGGGHKYGINAIKELAYQIIEIESMTNYEEGITVNVGYMKGGREVNVIPDHAEAKFEVRYWTEEQAEELDRKIMNMAPKVSGAQVEISLYRKTAPLERKEGNVKLFEIAKKIGEKIGVDIYETTIGGLSDANRIAHLNIPILDGLGAVGIGAHSKNELIYKDKIIERINLLLHILLELSKRKLRF